MSRYELICVLNCVLGLDSFNIEKRECHVYLHCFDLCNYLLKVCIVGFKDQLQLSVVGHLPLRAE